MTKDILIAILMSAINYIIVQAATGSASTKTENVTRFLLGETKQEIIQEIKEQAQAIRDAEKK